MFEPYSQSQTHASDVAETEHESVLGEIATRVLLTIWVLLVLPWLLFAPLSAMAFIVGDTWPVRLFVASVWSYGVAVFVAFKLLDRSRLAVLLPVLSIVAMFFFDLLAETAK
jgi:hypothetical protein